MGMSNTVSFIVVRVTFLMTGESLLLNTPFWALNISTSSSTSLSSGILSFHGEWCFWYELTMCFTRGAFDGRKLTASSTAFPCQNSAS